MSDDNLRIWSALAKTDPNQTKTFKRAGGFSGTAIKPIYQTQKMTEQFGPCGVGWGIGEPEFTVVPGHNGEVLVFCTVAVWHTTPEHRIYGVGGDKVVTHIKANDQYKRPERWENDDEAFKKAFTDAVGNAFKQLGMAADVHMGLFDDAKYVAGLRREAEDAKQAHVSDTEKPADKPVEQPKTPLMPHKIAPPKFGPNASTDEKTHGWRNWLTAMRDAIDNAPTLDELNKWISLNNDGLDGLRDFNPDGEDFLLKRADHKRGVFAQAPKTEKAA